MKKVREQLYEKFAAESDPIRDMNIGIGKFLKIEGDRLAHCKYNELQKEFDIEKYNKKYHIDTEDYKLFICLVTAQIILALGNKETVPNAFHDAYVEWERHIGNRRKIPGPYFTKVIIVQILKDKYGIEWDAQKVYEKFIEDDSDPIRDMSIGETKTVKEKLQKFRNLDRIKFYIDRIEVVQNCLKITASFVYYKWSIKQYFNNRLKITDLDKYLVFPAHVADLGTYKVYWYSIKKEYQDIFKNIKIE